MGEATSEAMESLMITAAEILQEISSFLWQKLLQIGEYLLIFFSIILDATVAFLQSLFYALSLLMLGTFSLGALVAQWLGDKLNLIYAGAVKFFAWIFEYSEYNNPVLIVGVILIPAVVLLLFAVLLRRIEAVVKEQVERQGIRSEELLKKQKESLDKRDKERQEYDEKKRREDERVRKEEKTREVVVSVVKLALQSIIK